MFMSIEKEIVNEVINFLVIAIVIIFSIQFVMILEKNIPKNSSVAQIFENLKSNFILTISLVLAIPSIILYILKKWEESEDIVVFIFMSVFRLVFVDEHVHR